MKAIDKKKDKKDKVKKKSIVKPKKEKVLVVAQEIKFARLLSGNEKKTRDRVLKTLKKWLLNCFDRNYEFKEDDFIRVWKGLFYAVWMSDKPLIQEDLCDSIAAILDLFPPDKLKPAMMMFRAGLKVLAIEWYGIDHHRMDKFLMLVRRYLRGALRCVLRSEWSEEACQMFSKALSGGDGLLACKTPLYAKNAMSLMLHVIDCYLEEIAKVSASSLPEAALAALLQPLVAYVCGGERDAAAAAARAQFTGLLRHSARGLDYGARHAAWQEMGCPEGGPDALEPASDDDDELEDCPDEGDERVSGAGALDPRAGRVDVRLAPLPPPAARLAAAFRAQLAAPRPRPLRAVRRATICMQRFEKLAQNEYPLRDEDTEVRARGAGAAARAHTARAARGLRALEKRLVAASDELALRGLHRKHRKRLLARARAGLSIVDAAPSAAPAAPADTANGEWQVEETKPKTSESKRDSSNKENLKKKNKKRKLELKLTFDSKKPKLDKKSGKDNLANKKISENKTSNKNKVDKDKNKVEKSAEIKSQASKTLKQKTDKKSKDNNDSNTPKLDKKLKLVFNENSKNTNKIMKSPNQKLTKETKTAVKPPAVLATKIKDSRFKDVPVSEKKKKNLQKTAAGGAGSPHKRVDLNTPKKVKFVLKNNSMQKPVDYYASVRRSPSLPFEPGRRPARAALKVCAPSPINPFFKNKLRKK